MSFSLEFYAKDPTEAHTLIDQQYAPESVRDFLHCAVSGCPDGEPLYVKAFGHLYNGDYNVSSATIQVTPITFTKPVEKRVMPDEVPLP